MQQDLNAKTDDKKIKKDMLISTLVKEYPQLVEPLMMMGMHCVGCFASQLETLEEAAMGHGIDPEEVIEELNEFLHQEEVQSS
ncbi:DUF1858 domain-containing protein [Treponema pectinovorum]|uniref:DUF1858 domain-containing protein n=1 Tax=Treponema pectinovorum TaxID=164 RepID=UPI003D934D42